MFCLKCGKILPSGTTVCPGCNTPVPGNSQTNAQTTGLKTYSSSDYRQESSQNDYRGQCAVPQPPPVPNAQQLNNEMMPPPVPNNAQQLNNEMMPPPVPNAQQQNNAMMPPPVPVVQTTNSPASVEPLQDSAARFNLEKTPQPLKPLPVQPASSPATSVGGTPLYGKSEFGAYQPDEPREAVNDHLVMSIVTLACCCMPAGIGGLIFSLLSKSSLSNGNFDKARSQAKTAYWFNLVGIIVGLLQALLVIIGNLIAQ